MPAIPATLRRLTIERAVDHCEYCGLSQAGQAATFHIDHITPVMAGGATAAENWDGVQVVGLTVTGRANIDALVMNRAIVLAIRAEEELLGRHPLL